MTRRDRTRESRGVRPPWHRQTAPRHQPEPAQHQPEPDTGTTPTQRVTALLLTVAVGMAFADTSIVVLALPSIYGEFSTTIVTVSWVLTGYAIAVCLTGLVLLRTRRALTTSVQLAIGLLLFVLACALCGFASAFSLLMAGRCLQGVAAALLLAAAVPALSERLGPAAGRSAWNTAAAIGLAAGPALGGILTELFDWRAIFLAQVPVALAGLVAISTGRTGPLVDLRARPDSPGRTDGPERHRQLILTHSGLTLLSGALVGALFLGVLLVVEVWRFTPLTGAFVVSALPAGMLLAVPARRPMNDLSRSATGSLLLASGLIGLAWLPGSGAGWAVPALALCGTGLGLMSQPLDKAALPPDGHPTRDGTFTVLSRHAGLVIGLLLIAPVLSGSLESATNRAVSSGTATVLDARISLQDKISIALALRDGLEESPRGHLPDLVTVLEPADADPKKERSLGLELQGMVQDILTRSFRSSFCIAAGFALLSLIPGLLLLTASRSSRQQEQPGQGPEGRPVVGTDPRLGPAEAGTTRSGAGGPAARLVVVTVLLAGAGIFLASEKSAGASEFGRVTIADPCRKDPDPYPGDGNDAALQRVALSTLNGAACEVGMSREEFIMGLDGKSRFGGRALTEDDIEPALRSGLRRAIDDAEKRDDLPGSLAMGLGFLVDHAPVSWLIDRLGLGGTD
jgi:MFS family permease